MFATPSPQTRSSNKWSSSGTRPFNSFTLIALGILFASELAICSPSQLSNKMFVAVENFNLRNARRSCFQSKHRLANCRPLRSIFSPSSRGNKRNSSFVSDGRSDALLFVLCGENPMEGQNGDCVILLPLENEGKGEELFGTKAPDASRCHGILWSAVARSICMASAIACVDCCC